MTRTERIQTIANALHVSVTIQPADDTGLAFVTVAAHGQEWTSLIADTDHTGNLTDAEYADQLAGWAKYIAQQVTAWRYERLAALLLRQTRMAGVSAQSALMGTWHPTRGEAVL